MPCDACNSFFSSARPTDDGWFKWKIFLTRKSKQKLFRFYLPYTSQASIQFLIIQPSQIPFYFFFILFWLRLRFNLPWISNLKKHLLSLLAPSSFASIVNLVVIFEMCSTLYWTFEKKKFSLNFHWFIKWNETKRKNEK